MHESGEGGQGASASAIPFKGCRVFSSALMWRSSFFRWDLASVQPLWVSEFGRAVMRLIFPHVWMPTNVFFVHGVFGPPRDPGNGLVCEAGINLKNSLQNGASVKSVLMMALKAVENTHL